MTTLSSVIRRYQRWSPETQAFDSDRSMSEYARLLDISPAQLSRIYAGERQPGITVMRKLLRAFPDAEGLAAEISAAMLASNGHNPAPQPVAAGGDA